MAPAVTINHPVTATPADDTAHMAEPMFPSAEHLLPYGDLSEDGAPKSFLQLVLEHGGSTGGHAWWQSSPEDPEDLDYKPWSTDSSSTESDSSGYHTADSAEAGPSSQPSAQAQQLACSTAAPLPEADSMDSELGLDTVKIVPDAIAAQAQMTPDSATDGEHWSDDSVLRFSEGSTKPMPSEASDEEPAEPTPSETSSEDMVEEQTGGDSDEGLSTRTEIEEEEDEDHLPLRQRAPRPLRAAGPLQPSHLAIRQPSDCTPLPEMVHHCPRVLPSPRCQGTNDFHRMGSFDQPPHVTQQ
ncbi:hypothetical protein LPJ61_003297 [Coemansia biformis]|uniref:Uncharacterized protein n=1 Tax=Coemansia biformis TaxID=1286918 RepID=A0A9W7YD52_9FUNG|nr:hypothetical protein LPJ61_003297 [Coemansia biformis]